MLIISNQTSVPDYQKNGVTYTMSPDNAVLKKRKELWKRYMNSNPYFDCFFIEYHPEKNFIIEDNTLLIKGVETFHPGCRDKTIDSFNYFLSINVKYDFVVRTNLSSLWNFEALNLYLETLPKTGLYSGVIGNHNGLLFASGSGFIMTLDVVKKIVENRSLCDNFNMIDDLDIAYLLKEIGIYPTSNTRTDILNKEIFNNFHYRSNIYHYRVKWLDFSLMNEELEARSRILDMIMSGSIPTSLGNSC